MGLFLQIQNVCKLRTNLISALCAMHHWHTKSLCTTKQQQQQNKEQNKTSLKRKKEQKHNGHLLQIIETVAVVVQRQFQKCPDSWQRPHSFHFRKQVCSLSSS